MIRLNRNPRGRGQGTAKIGAACQIRKGGLAKGDLVKQLRTQERSNTTYTNSKMGLFVGVDHAEQKEQAISYYVVLVHKVQM